MGQKVAIGIQNFETIIINNYFYIDKTNFIKEWWESGDSVTLITRPRRFGKTLNMSMLDYFFANRHAGRSDLFEGLFIWNEEMYRQLACIYNTKMFSSDELRKEYENSIESELVCIVDNINKKLNTVKKDTGIANYIDEFTTIGTKVMTSLRDVDETVNITINFYGGNYEKKQESDNI